MLREISTAELYETKDKKGYYILVSRYRPRWIKKEEEMWDEWDRNLAPSEQLLNDFKEKSKEFGKDSIENHNKSFKSIDYEKRFRKEILNNTKALKKMESVSKDSINRDIYFVCFEGLLKACHRRILLRICEKKYGAKVQVDGVES